VALADRSHCGRIRITGQDRLSFLHSQSTQDLANMQPGSAADTVRVLAGRVRRTSFRTSDMKGRTCNVPYTYTHAHVVHTTYVAHLLYAYSMYLCSIGANLKYQTCQPHV
jgi:folate-binding Fe-S cluster repair protein YgfZ